MGEFDMGCKVGTARTPGALLSRKAPEISNRGWQKRLSTSLKRSAMYGGIAAERHEALGPPGNDIYVNKQGAAAAASP